MKRILSILFLLAVSFAANSQGGTRMPLAAGDTVVNTTTSARKIIPVTGKYAGIVVQADLSPIGGTLNGTITMAGSVSGISYTTIGSAYTFSNTNTSAMFYIAAPLPPFLKVTATGSTGTFSAVQSVYYRFTSY